MSRILLVEDNPAEAKLVTLMLEDGVDGFVVSHCSRLQDARHLLAKEEFDAVLLDLSLPDAQGLEALVALKKMTRVVPIIVRSGIDDEQIALEAITHGAQDYILKGNNILSLKRSIKFALERHRNREELRLVEAAFTQTETAMIIMNDQRQPLLVNPAFTDLTGLTFSDVESQCLVGKFTRENADLGEEIELCLLKDGEWDGELLLPVSGDRHLPVWVMINAVRGDLGALVGYVMCIQDVSHFKSTEERLRHLASYDVLTGLPNRYSSRRMIEHSMTEAHASSYYCAVLFLDLDGFKAVNDKYGHRAGDQVLRETGRRLQDCVRHSDQVARLGGDEFIVLLNSIKKHSDAEVIAQKIVEIIHAPFPLENGASVQLSTSIGIAIYPGDAVNADELISRADEAMYAVKHREKNGYAFSCDLKESQKPNVA